MTLHDYYDRYFPAFREYKVMQYMVDNPGFSKEEVIEKLHLNATYLDQGIDYVREFISFFLSYEFAIAIKEATRKKIDNFRMLHGGDARNFTDDAILRIEPITEYRIIYIKMMRAAEILRVAESEVQELKEASEEDKASFKDKKLWSSVRSDLRTTGSQESQLLPKRENAVIVLEEVVARLRDEYREGLSNIPKR